MEAHSFEWKKEGTLPTWNLYMDGMMIYFAFQCEKKRNVWSALDNLEGCTDELASLRWFDIDEAKKHILDLAKEKYKNTAKLCPEYVRKCNEGWPVDEQEDAQPQQETINNASTDFLGANTPPFDDGPNSFWH